MRYLRAKIMNTTLDAIFLPHPVDQRPVLNDETHITQKKIRGGGEQLTTMLCTCDCHCALLDQLAVVISLRMKTFELRKFAFSRFVFQKNDETWHRGPTPILGILFGGGE
jgi:hypothetical protein